MLRQRIAWQGKSWLRHMHSSPSLDPTHHVPQATGINVAETASRPFVESQANVHVKLSYLHPSTKVPPPVPRTGDLKTGRVRPVPEYVPLSSHVFATEPRNDILHASVVYTLDGRRQGTASTKTRGEVNYSGRKLRPQKGTGQARLGSRGSPMLRGGGVAHGPKPRDMSSKLNRRVRELATRNALSLRWKTDNLHVVKSLFWDPPPNTTGALRRLLKTRGWEDALILTAPRSPQPHPTLNVNKPSAQDPMYTSEQMQSHDTDISSFLSAARNIPRLQVVRLHRLHDDTFQPQKTLDDKKPSELHAYDILRRNKVICDLGAVEWLEEKLGGAIFHELDSDIALHNLSLEGSESISQDSSSYDNVDQEDQAILQEAQNMMKKVEQDRTSA